MKYREPLRQYIRDDLLGGRIELAYTDELLMQGIIDSMAIMRLVAFIEKKFGVSVPPQDMIIENFSTVETISRYLETRS